MTPGTFLKRTLGMVTGDGFLREIQGINANSLKVTADGTVLTAASVPAVAALETSFMGVVLAAGQTALGTLSFIVPRDYDKSKDIMRFRFLANSAGATNSPTIDAAIYQKKVGTALSSDLNPTISAAVVGSITPTDDAAIYQVVATGLGIEPGAALTVVFTASSHGTDALNVYGLEVQYYSDLVHFDIDDRS